MEPSLNKLRIGIHLNFIFKILSISLEFGGGKERTTKRKGWSARSVFWRWISSFSFNAKLQTWAENWRRSSSTQLSFQVIKIIIIIITLTIMTGMVILVKIISYWASWGLASSSQSSAELQFNSFLLTLTFPISLHLFHLIIIITMTTTTTTAPKTGMTIRKQNKPFAFSLVQKLLNFWNLIQSRVSLLLAYPLLDWPQTFFFSFSQIKFYASEWEWVEFGVNLEGFCLRGVVSRRREGRRKIEKWVGVKMGIVKLMAMAICSLALLLHAIQCNVMEEKRKYETMLPLRPLAEQGAVDPILEQWL